MIDNSQNPQLPMTACYAQVFLGDCLELYKTIEPKSIDLILTDLPYGTTACKWDTIIPFDKLWEMVNYLLKSNGAFITTDSQPFTSALVMSNPKMFKYEWIWEKDRPSNPLVANKRVMPQHENVLIFYQKQPIFNPQKVKRLEKNLRKNKNNLNHTHTTDTKSNTNIIVSDGTEYRYPYSINHFSCVKYNGLHPTQKPTELFEYLLKTYSNENMIIFDPCMGSGTTGVACKNTNRNFIGIEKEEQYFKIAEQRINVRTLF